MLTNVEFSGIDFNDYPDFVDAYILSAQRVETGLDLTEDELDKLNDDRDTVYEYLMKHLY